MERYWDEYALEAMRIASRDNSKERGAAAAFMLLEKARWDMKDREVIEGNLKKLMGRDKDAELPEGLFYSWCSESRVFKVGFYPNAYRHHGHLMLKTMIQAMHRAGFPMFSGPKWDCWIGYFPRPVYGCRQIEKNVEEVVEEKVEKVEKIEEVKPAFQPRVVRRRAE